MLRRRRLAWAASTIVLLAVVGFSIWTIVQVRNDLAEAEASADRLERAVRDRDRGATEQAISDLQEAASSAADGTDSAWWTAATHLPLLGDDATGIRALTRSLDTLAADGLAPLAATIHDLEQVVDDGGVDLDLVEELEAPVGQAHASFAAAREQVEGLDSSGYAGSVRARFDDYVRLVGDTSDALSSGELAVEVLPAMAGQDEPRSYLMVFQNNAEIRATGGMPGSWAVLRADDGRLSMTQQGTPGQFGVRRAPLPMSPAEREVYSTVMGLYFQSANFTPDFPRAAELWSARFGEEVPGVELDGVLALDPVALSYLLEGTGPVRTGGRTLTAGNAVHELLSRPYLELDTAAQDAFFARAAKSIFEASTGDLADPIGFVSGLQRAAEEGRFLVAPADPAERERLDGTRILGSLAGDDGETPHVDIGLNDATASKMSYYLRYSAEVDASACQGSTQRLRGSMSLGQSIAPSEAAQLPESVTGPGGSGAQVGAQLVAVRIYGPYGGTVQDIRLNGKATRVEAADLDGRPVVTLLVETSTTEDDVISWTMHTGPGQVGDVRLGMTPSIVPGSNDRTSRSAC